MGPPSMNGAHIVASTLQALGVKVVFGIVGIPIIEVAEQCMSHGIRFIGFRNEQAASYAATAYGYLTNRPGVCLVVGGPGVLHAMAGVGNSNANRFPLLLLAGSCETHLVGKGAFQELDAIKLLRPHCKVAVQPRALNQISQAIQDAYDMTTYSEPGTAFVDLPADIIQARSDAIPGFERRIERQILPSHQLSRREGLEIATMLRNARAPLIVIGKGAAYARAEEITRDFINQTSLPFLPSPMGKGVIRDSHPLNCASARSTALSNADVVLVLCARLNWMFHFGEPPKWDSNVRFILLDISSKETDGNNYGKELTIACNIVQGLSQLLDCLQGWKYNAQSSSFTKKLSVAKAMNEEKAKKSVQKKTMPLSLAHAFSVIKSSLNALSPPSEGGIVYVSEGANSMDVSRSVFPVEYPRLRLDAGTNAAMGVGMGYAIAAHEAYNGAAHEASSGTGGRKKIVALEGDSAFGFSAMELETMARFQMDVLVFVMNNGGVYHGDSDSAEEWLEKQAISLNGVGAEAGEARGVDRLRSTSLGWEVGYEKIAEACGGKGRLVRTVEELKAATVEGYQATVPFIVNVIIESGKESKLNFGWQASAKKRTEPNSSRSKL